jgi:hypothetical protein
MLLYLSPDVQPTSDEDVFRVQIAFDRLPNLGCGTRPKVPNKLPNQIRLSYSRPRQASGCIWRPSPLNVIQAEELCLEKFKTGQLQGTDLCIGASIFRRTRVLQSIDEERTLVSHIQ